MPRIASAKGSFVVSAGAELSSFVQLTTAGAAFVFLAGAGVSFAHEMSASVVMSIQGRVANGTQSARISALAQSLTVEGLIDLWTLDLSHMGMGTARFTTDVSRINQPVRWGGNEYVPWPIAAEGFERNSQGASPRPTLRVAAVLPVMTSLIIGATGLQGATVTRTRTFARFLDDGEEPSTTDHFPIESYRIERVSEYVLGQYATFELASPLDMEDAMFPKRQVIRDYCSWRYRFWDMTAGRFSYSKISPCPYAGKGAWDRMNRPVAQQLDVCNKTLTACKLRFGATADLPYGGFPGAAPMQR